MNIIRWCTAWFKYYADEITALKITVANLQSAAGEAATAPPAPPTAVTPPGTPAAHPETPA